MIKNSTNQHISFLMLSATDGSGVNTGTTYVAICKDGGGPVTATNSPAHKSNGAWTLDLSQAETNCDHLLAVMTISGAITAMVQVYPVDPASFKADVSALATSTEIDDIKGAAWSSSTDTLQLIRDRVDLDITLTAGQNDFNPATDPVANVTLVATTTTNSDMRGTDNANTVAPDNASVALILADTNELQQNQGDWATATGFATINPDNAGITANGTAIAANLTAINNLNDVTVQEFWDALTSGSYASGSFGERLLRSTTQHAEVAVTGSNHVAADIHELQDDVITAATLDATAITDIQSGLALATELALVPKTGSPYTHTNQAGDTMTVTIT
jgi:hypothetical protein